MNKQKIVLATGGTGGHIFPAFALAEELMTQNFDPIIIADKRFLKYKNHNEQITSYIIHSASFRSGIFSKLITCFNIIIGVLHSLILLQKIKPSLIVGFGGYPSFPSIMAAYLLGIPIILHEQNSVIGKVNRFFLGKAKFLATSFPEVLNVPNKYLNKVIYTGNPVRKKILNTKENLPNQDKVGIFIVGGSGGASVFSKIVPAALELMDRKIRDKLIITAQCPKQDVAGLKQNYEELGVTANVASFFLNIEDEYQKANLVIARAGASTISELLALKKPAIIVPLPTAADNHQLYNAKFFIENFGGILIEQHELTPAYLADILTELITKPEVLMNISSKFNKKPFDFNNNLSRLVINYFCKGSD